MRGVSYVQARVPMSLLQGTATLPTSPMCGASGCACESRVAFLGLCHRHRNARRQWLSLPCRYTEDMAQPIPGRYTDGPTSQSAYASGERNEVQGGPLQRAGNVRDACASSFARGGPRRLYKHGATDLNRHPHASLGPALVFQTWRRCALADMSAKRTWRSRGTTTVLYLKTRASDPAASSRIESSRTV
jgi:hypothetical protein